MLHVYDGRLDEATALLNRLRAGGLVSGYHLSAVSAAIADAERALRSGPGGDHRVGP